MPRFSGQHINRVASPRNVTSRYSQEARSKPLENSTIFLEQKIMSNLFTRFAKDESGATAIEYGLIAGLISVVILAVLGSIGSKLNTKFTNISNALN